MEAIRLGRRYVGIELEPRYAALQRANLARVPPQNAGAEFAVHEADARRLDPDSGPTKPPIEDLGPIDAVLTSPPFGGRLEPSRTHLSPGFLDLVQGKKLGATAVPVSAHLRPDNLGNLKEDADYFAGMRAVYAGCFHRLKPGGVMALTLRFGREGERLRALHHETALMCTALGFTFVDEIVALLARIATPQGETARVIGHASFGHRRAIGHLRSRGVPASLNQVEYVLVFQKPRTPAEEQKIQP